ncbi:MAG: hypothetical protein DDG60_16550 [Anaerolineae bacterium]|nr:MAG: hypothetical protein DDG60_16550 [Anaerolineae bacterium]
MASWRNRVFSTSLALAFRVGLFDRLRLLHAQSLTVLNYHRIDHFDSPEFDLFKPNVSATPQEFSRQMDYVRGRYNVISVQQLAAWLKGEASLPPHAALITFDDGYADNLTYAFPILKACNLPAVIFLTTGFLETTRPFYWDLVAYCFHHTRRDSVILPGLGERFWNSVPQREKIMRAWIEMLKTLPDDEKNARIENLPASLGVSIPEKRFAGLYLTWEQIRTMHRQGIEFGSHTVSHPILTRISLEQVHRELTESRRTLEQEIGEPVVSLAYPNGQATDFSPAVVHAAQQAGFLLAFSLLPGPTRYQTVRRSPFTIRRIYIGNTDTLPRFAAKLSGLARLSAVF